MNHLVHERQLLVIQSDSTNKMSLTLDDKITNYWTINQVDLVNVQNSFRCSHIINGAVFFTRLSPMIYTVDREKQHIISTKQPKTSLIIKTV